MGCSLCMSYNRMLSRCSRGKANPPTRKRAQEMAGLMGIATLCYMNPWRDQLVIEFLEQRTMERKRILLSQMLATR